MIFNGAVNGAVVNLLQIGGENFATIVVIVTPVTVESSCQHMRYFSQGSLSPTRLKSPNRPAWLATITVCELIRENRIVPQEDVWIVFRRQT